MSTPMDLVSWLLGVTLGIGLGWTIGFLIAEPKIRELQRKFDLMTEVSKEAIALGEKAYADGNGSHFRKWLGTANTLDGPTLFTDGERAHMEYMHAHGYGWRQALDKLQEYRGRNAGMRFDR